MFSRSVHSAVILGPSVDYTIVSVYFTYLTARPRPDDVTFVSAGYAFAQSCENHLVSYRNYMVVIINAISRLLFIYFVFTTSSDPLSDACEIPGPGA